MCPGIASVQSAAEQQETKLQRPGVSFMAGGVLS